MVSETLEVFFIAEEAKSERRRRVRPIELDDGGAVL